MLTIERALRDNIPASRLIDVANDNDQKAANTKSRNQKRRLGAQARNLREIAARLDVARRVASEEQEAA